MSKHLSTEEIIALGNTDAPKDWLDSLAGIESEGAPDEVLAALMAQDNSLDPHLTQDQIQADYAFKYYQCSGANYTAGRGGNAITHIVMHYTAGSVTAEGAALANCQYFANGSRGASAHYFIDDGYPIWQSVNLNDTAWHAGNWSMNQRSIGIEVCTAGGYTESEIDRAAFLVQHLMALYGIPMSNVIRHYDVTGKLCPAAYTDWSKWAWLHNEIMTRGKGQTVSDSTNIQLYHSNATDAQRWRLTRDADGQKGYCTLQNVASGKFLDLADGAVKNGQNIHAYPGNGADAQKWILESHVLENDAFVIIRSKINEDYVVDVANGSYDDGANIQLYKGNGTTAQQFGLVYAGMENAYFIVNQGSGKCLDVVGGN